MLTDAGLSIQRPLTWFLGLVVVAVRMMMMMMVMATNESAVEILLSSAFHYLVSSLFCGVLWTCLQCDAHSRNLTHES
jgi:hypothetical protein